MADEPIKPDKPTYDLEPETRGADPSQPAVPKARPASPVPGEPRPKIDKPGLLDDFDEDADFTLDPEVDKALGKPTLAQARAKEAEAAAADPARWLIQPGFPQFRSAAIIAAVLGITATVLSGVQAQYTGIWEAVYALYQILLHTGTGLLACLIAARLSERGFNQPELAAARIAIAVSTFYLLRTARFPIPGPIEEILLAAAGYLGALFLVFRLPRFETGILAGAHGGIWLLTQIGGEIAAQIHRVAASAPGVTE